MKFDDSILTDVIEKIQSGTTKDRKISLYSVPAMRILRYLDMTTPRFSRSGAAAQLLTAAVEKAYPELWKAVSDSLPDRTRETDVQFMPETIENVDGKILQTAFEETSTSQGAIVTIYSQRLTAVFRYFSLIKPRYSISNESGSLLEKELAEKYPGMWEMVKVG
jgi:hypothetical protein